MIVFCLSIHHLWGRTLAQHYQDACAVAYADDGYIKAKLSVALEVLSDIKLVLKEDAGLDINDKTKILVRGITSAEAHAAAQRLLADDPSLTHLGPLLTPEAFVDNRGCGVFAAAFLWAGRLLAAGHQSSRAWGCGGGRETVWVSSGRGQLQQACGFTAV